MSPGGWHCGRVRRRTQDSTRPARTSTPRGMGKCYQITSI